VPAGLGGTRRWPSRPVENFLAAASYDTNVRAWNSRNGELLRLIDELPVATFALAFSPDGRYLAAAGVGPHGYLFDAKSWKLARKLSGQPEMISALLSLPTAACFCPAASSELTIRNAGQGSSVGCAAGKVLRTFPSAQRGRFGGLLGGWRAGGGPLPASSRPSAVWSLAANERE